MNPGDLVVVDAGCLPLVSLGRFMGFRSEVTNGTYAVILEFKEHWGETWYKILLPTGIGWVMPRWVTKIE